MSHKRIVVTGLTGQVVSALIERAPPDVELIALGRPRLDLSVREAVLAALRATHCDAIVNAAAYTAVDKAESEPDVAHAGQCRRRRLCRGDRRRTATSRCCIISTDYVFDGRLDRPYREDDSTGPTSAYGRSKLVGEQRIAQIHDNHAILRTAWVYSPSGANFVRTMLRLGQSREEVGVVADQLGNPTSALDIADAVLTIARRMVADSSPSLRGLFHMTGRGGSVLGRIRRGDFRGRRKARARAGAGQKDRHGGLSHARAAPRQFAAGLRKAATDLWRRSAALAGVAGALRGAAAGGANRLTFGPTRLVSLATLPIKGRDFRRIIPPHDGEGFFFSVFWAGSGR